MLGDCCTVCGNLRAKDPTALFHCFPLDLNKKRFWMEEFELTERSIKRFSCVYSKYFRNVI